MDKETRVWVDQVTMEMSAICLNKYFYLPCFISFIRMKSTLHDHNMLSADFTEHQLTFVTLHWKKNKWSTEYTVDSEHFYTFNSYKGGHQSKIMNQQKSLRNDESNLPVDVA